MEISVIIPVYRAEAYVQQAVESALAQPETAEVVLVEDGSPDGSLTVCEALAARSAKVKLYRHPDGQNRGAAASRNLGILHSQSEVVAFLDADDYYLPGRFARARAILEARPEIDGVYEAIGFHFQNEAARQRWTTDPGNQQGMFTVLCHSEPEDLLAVFATGLYGIFHLDGLTVRRRGFELTGLLDETLRIGQDTVLRIKLATMCRLAPGSRHAPVGMLRLHHQNSISAQYKGMRTRYRLTARAGAVLQQWAKSKLPKTKQTLITLFTARRLADSLFYDPHIPPLPAKIGKRIFLMIAALQHPRFWVTSAFWQIMLPYSITSRRGPRRDVWISV
jgi:glycosyltransferase involved in cell wall biosynthesis